MAKYRFKCKKCGERFTITTNLENKPKLQCPKCKTLEIEPFYEKHLETPKSTDDNFSCFT